MIQIFYWNIKWLLYHISWGLIGIGLFACGSDTIPITSTSDKARELYLQARELFEEFHIQKSRELLDEVINLDSTFALAYLQLSYLQNTNKERLFYLDQALDYIDYVSDAEGWMILAQEAGVNGFSLQQREYYQKILDKYPQDERAHNLLAHYYFFYEQDYKKAVDIYQQAIKINPNFSVPYNGLGYSYRYLEKYPEAEQAFKKYIKLVPDSPNPYDSYAELLLKMGEFEVSIEYYQKALSIDSSYMNAYRGIATNLILKREYQEARRQIKDLYRIARDDGDRRNAFYTMAVCLIDEGEYEKALQFLDKRYQLAANNSDTTAMAEDLYLIGMVLLEIEKYDQAEHKFEQAIDIVVKSNLSTEIKNVYQINKYLFKGLSALKKDAINMAKNYAQQFSNGAKALSNPNQTRALHALNGMILLKEKRYDQAIEEFTQADQSIPIIVFSLAQAYQGTGNKEKALELYNKTARFNSLNDIFYAFYRHKAEIKMAEVKANLKS
jgi:tetratricopeptide (TPR) repeat protein